MGEEPNTPAPPRAIRQEPIVSAICPDDLGLKAGFWTKEDGDVVTFRPIVGWVTVMNFTQSGVGPFVPLVLNNLAFPTFATDSNYPTYVGVFSKALTPEEAREKLKGWVPQKENATSGNQVTLNTDAGLTLTLPTKTREKGKRPTDDTASRRSPTSSGLGKPTGR